MSEVITLGRRLNDLNIKIQDKILSNEKLISLTPVSSPSSRMRGNLVESQKFFKTSLYRDKQ